MPRSMPCSSPKAVNASNATSDRHERSPNLGELMQIVDVALEGFVFIANDASANLEGRILPKNAQNVV